MAHEVPPVEGAQLLPFPVKPVPRSKEEIEREAKEVLSFLPSQQRLKFGS